MQGGLLDAIPHHMKGNTMSINLNLTIETKAGERELRNELHAQLLGKLADAIFEIADGDREVFERGMAVAPRFFAQTYAGARDAFESQMTDAFDAEYGEPETEAETA